jgi:hypothetical protein
VADPSPGPLASGSFHRPSLIEVEDLSPSIIQSDQLSDYRVDVPYIQADIHRLSSRSVLNLEDSATVLRDEEVAGSNPVTPTLERMVRYTLRS